MKLYNSSENTFYLFKDKSYVDGVCCRSFDWKPGERNSSLFNNEEAIKWLAEVGGSIEFVDLGKPLMIINGKYSNYGDWYSGDNFANTVGSLIDSNDAEQCSCPWLDQLAEVAGSVSFWYVNGKIMVEIWGKGKKGSFCWTNSAKFIELLEKFYANL